MQYQVLVRPHPDKAFVALVLGWPDCVADGKTKEEAIANAQDALTQRLAQGEIVTIEVGMPPRPVAPSHWESLEERLNEVMQDDDYDEDYAAPSESAYTRTKNFLYEAYKVFADNLPIPYFVPDGDGGLRLRWLWQDREIRLLCPAQDTKPCHIYFEEGEIYGAEEATLETFLNRMNWLLVR